MNALDRLNDQLDLLSRRRQGKSSVKVLGVFVHVHITRRLKNVS